MRLYTNQELLEQASTPLSLHLDHGKDLEIIRSCMENGFTSVMIDGSHLEFNENVAVPKSVVGMAQISRPFKQR